MSSRASILANLYKRGKVTKDGLKQAVKDGVITEAEYLEIVGETYVA